MAVPIAPKGYVNQKAYLDFLLGPSVDCFDPKGCGFQNTGSKQTCYLNQTVANRTAGNTQAFLPMACAAGKPKDTCYQQCIGFDTQAIAPEATLVDFSDTAPQNLKDTFCLTEPFDSDRRTMIETILSNDAVCSTTPQQCGASSGCEGKGLGCCGNNSPQLLHCMNNGDGTYNGYFQCVPTPSCGTSGAISKYYMWGNDGNCYLNRPPPAGCTGCDGNPFNCTLEDCTTGGTPWDRTHHYTCNESGNYNNIENVPAGTWYCVGSDPQSPGGDDCADGINQPQMNVGTWTQCTTPGGCPLSSLPQNLWYMNNWNDNPVVYCPQNMFQPY